MGRKSRTPGPGTVLVVGLGRFGTAICESLTARGTEVMAIDTDEHLVQRYADELTHAVVADATDAEAMAQLGVGSVDVAVVAIGSDVEASVLSVVTLVEAGVGTVYAKAVTPQHARILSSIGATHVILPELVMGRRVAAMVSGELDPALDLEDREAAASPRPARD